MLNSPKRHWFYLVPSPHGTPLDATQYFLTNDGNNIATASSQLTRVYVPRGLIVGFRLGYSVLGTLGSNETVTVKLYKNGSAAGPSIPVQLNSATPQFATDYANPFAVAFGDYIECVQEAVTWATNPTTVRWNWGFVIQPFA